MATQLSLESGVLCKYTSYIGVSFLSYVRIENNDRHSMSVGCTKISDMNDLLAMTNYGYMLEN